MTKRNGIEPTHKHYAFGYRRVSSLKQSYERQTKARTKKRRVLVRGVHGAIERSGHAGEDITSLFHGGFT